MDSQAAHHIGQRELFEHGFAAVSLVREARGLDFRDRELDGREVNGGVVTAVGPRIRRILAIEDVLVDDGPGYAGLRLLSGRLEEEALC
jgi:hypothetical protein